jgi:hypothetical protein
MRQITARNRNYNSKSRSLTFIGFWRTTALAGRILKLPAARSFMAFTICHGVDPDLCPQWTGGLAACAVLVCHVLRVNIRLD